MTLDTGCTVHMPEGAPTRPGWLHQRCIRVHGRAAADARNGATDGADQRELAPGDDRRWVMSHTTCVLPTSPVFRRVSLTRRRHRWASPVSRVVSPVPSSLVSKSVSRCALWPAASWIFVYTRTTIPGYWAATIDLHIGDRAKRAGDRARFTDHRPSARRNRPDLAR
jgi:hypothetical protein